MPEPPARFYFLIRSKACRHFKHWYLGGRERKYSLVTEVKFFLPVWLIPDIRPPQAVLRGSDVSKCAFIDQIYTRLLSKPNINESILKIA